MKGAYDLARKRAEHGLLTIRIGSVIRTASIAIRRPIRWRKHKKPDEPAP